MENYLKKAFAKTKLSPKDSLADDAWHSIVLRDKRITRLKLWIFSLIGFVSLTGLIPVSRMLLSDLSHSGLYEYLSLAFSSGGSMLVYWKDFLSLLAESLPTMSIISSLTLIFIFFISLKYAVREIIKGQLTLSF